MPQEHSKNVPGTPPGTSQNHSKNTLPGPAQPGPPRPAEYPRNVEHHTKAPGTTCPALTATRPHIDYLLIFRSICSFLLCQNHSGQRRLPLKSEEVEAVAAMHAAPLTPPSAFAATLFSRAGYPMAATRAEKREQPSGCGNSSNIASSKIQYPRPIEIGPP